MATKIITAPIAIIKVGGQPVGKMRNIRFTETIRRGKVMGLGTLTPCEVPALEWDGSLNCGFYLIDLSKTVFENRDVGKAMYRGVQSVEEFADTLLLQEDGIQLDVYRKVRDTIDQFGVIKHRLEIFASIQGVFITRESMDITESQISGRDADFEYITPIIFPA